MLTGPSLLWAGQAQIVHGADMPSVRLQTGVKFEHFVYPLRVEGNIYKKCRLWRCTFCPLDAHTNDDFALMFLTNQRATIVFLQEKGEKNNYIFEIFTFENKNKLKLHELCNGLMLDQDFYLWPLHHIRLLLYFRQHISGFPQHPLWFVSTCRCWP